MLSREDKILYYTISGQSSNDVANSEKLFRIKVLDRAERNKAF